MVIRPGWWWVGGAAAVAVAVSLGPNFKSDQRVWEDQTIAMWGEKSTPLKISKGITCPAL
jgi:hypothetical protein